MTATPGTFDTGYYSGIVNSVNTVDNINGGWFCT
jgi:hypothetical protein